MGGRDGERATFSRGFCGRGPGEIVSGRDGGSGRLPEINVISSAVAEKIRAQRARAIDPRPFLRNVASRRTNDRPPSTGEVALIATRDALRTEGICHACHVRAAMRWFVRLDRF